MDKQFDKWLLERINKVGEPYSGTSLAEEAWKARGEADMAEHDRAVRLEEASNWYDSFDSETHAWHLTNESCWGCKRIASLQPKAKEPAA